MSTVNKPNCDNLLEARASEFMKSDSAFSAIHQGKMWWPRLTGRDKRQPGIGMETKTADELGWHLGNCIHRESSMLLV